MESIKKGIRSLTNQDTSAWHGFKGDHSWKLPKLVAKSDQANRADQGNTIKANEYLDDAEVLDAKMTIIANMIKKSEYLIAYTGAGLSRASGIPDYASKSKESIIKAPKLKSNLDAQPTFAHHCLTSLEKAGYLKYYVQQNHDGLPQKAGFPQEKMNEIHGAWFDPSNPVVQFSGSLRGDLFREMERAEKKVDMCLCLGTSLSGMNADRMANTPARRSLQGEGLGTVIINLQQTPLDEKCAIRVFAELDVAFKILLQKLNLAIASEPYVPKIPDGHEFWIPYNADGKKDDTVMMKLDMREGSKIRIAEPKAMNAGCEGKISGMRDGNYSCLIYEQQKGITVSVGRLFGAWWIESAINGTIARLPLTNANPEILTLEEYREKFPSIEQVQEEMGDGMEIEEKKEPESISIIQSHALVPTQSDNHHRWGLQVDPRDEDNVAQVEYVLHPTFNPPTIQCTQPPFSISRIGWGTFEVGCNVTLKNGRQIQGCHKLTFTGEGDNVRSTSIQV